MNQRALRAFWLLAAAWAMGAWGLPIARLGAQEQIEEALRLARQGETEKAEKICRTIQTDSQSSAAARAALDFVRAELTLNRALREPDLTAFMGLMDESISLVQRFLRQAPGSPLAMEARRGLDWRRHRKAERAGNASRAETDPTKRSHLVKQALSHYSDLQVAFQDRLQELNRAAITPESQNELAELLLDLPRVLYEHARLPGLEEDRRKRMLEEAISRLQDFQLDQCNNAMAFEAMWVEGQCHAELGDLPAGRSRLESALRLGARLAEAKKEPNEYCQGVMGGAAISLVEALMRAGQRAEAMAAADRWLKDPIISGIEAGKMLKILKADCLFQDGDLAGALRLAAEVADADPESRAGKVARERMKAWASQDLAAGGPATPQHLLSTAEALMDREAWQAAIQSLERLLADQPTPEDRDKFHPEAYFKIGQCQERMGRHAEATSAFEKVLELFPKHELAPRACFEAARSSSAAFGSSRDPKDDAKKDALLSRLSREWPNHPANRDVPFLVAEKAERAREFARAAEEYGKVPEESELHEAALLGVARSSYNEANARWEKKGEGGSEAEARKLLLEAERIAEALLAGSSKERNGGRELRSREAIEYQAVQLLAQTRTHEGLGKLEECLAALAEYRKSLKPQDPRLARIWGLEVAALARQGKSDEAVKIAEAMLEQFPGSPWTPAASKTAAIQLRRATEALVAAQGDVEAIRESSRKVHLFHMKWIQESLTRGQQVKVGEGMAAADALYDAARRLNGLDDRVASFVDLEATLPAKGYFSDAATVTRHLVDGKMGKLADKDRIRYLARLARCSSFGADELGDWESAKACSGELLRASHLLDGQDHLDRAVLQTDPGLLLPYIELGAVYLELARRGQGFQYDNALKVFSNVHEVVESGSEPWWIIKYLTLQTLFARGASGDARTARTLLENLEKSYPDFDGDKFRIKSRLLRLKTRMDQVMG